MSSNSGLADAFHPATASTRSTSTVRPRTRRLISIVDSDNDDSGRQMQSSGLSSMLSSESVVRSRGATPSPNPSRGVSPIPMKHPSRATESFNRNRGNSSLDFLDASWSSLQSLASSVLGSDIARPAPNGNTRTHARKPSRPDLYSRPPPRSSIPASWGPSAPLTPEVGIGTKEERQALVQAKKREALLLADTGPDWTINSRHKRRDSSDQTGHSNIDPEQDEDALVYIHHVQATDTITGVTIRYGCQPAIFRKANGFWPSDSIQGRKTVLLPVDSCSVKGRPIRDEANAELSNGTHESLEDLNGSSIAPTAVPWPPKAEISHSISEGDGDRVWKHESWVQIEGFGAPVEIGRIPRGALGFFPRTRRKSVSCTDSVPSPSSDQGRTATTSSVSSSPAEPQSFNPAIFQWSRQPTDPSSSKAPKRPGARHQRQRSGIQFSAPGVGTLDRDITAPGPAMDGLSKFFAHHLPNLAPATRPPDFDTTSDTPTASAVSNTPTGLENIGGAVESWVRKMTSRAKASLNDLQQATNAPNNPDSTIQIQPNGRHRAMGDLIELHGGLEPATTTNHPPGPADASTTNTRRAKLERSAGSASSSLLPNGTSSSSSPSTLRGRFATPSPGRSSRTQSGAERDRYKDD
ncbi:putative LysM domain protein [Aspergillus homomorphus CBS 101889]|uniref:LysM domain-containing protein n=1 Tax=Aspergillus homomorphus (strain CBS 101889) TaxID=1450537 RepID=A0A395I0V0_ASPHC|nr:hypothetical protein BO97DRAFT_35952 [Aspergillus homomorphus CBS 101889]RAL13690.1 hypothetical protein BO97DRAFT_35952 [Aspergillus homomorphus CBS 101889]